MKYNRSVVIRAFSPPRLRCLHLTHIEVCAPSCQPPASLTTCHRHGYAPPIHLRLHGLSGARGARTHSVCSGGACVWVFSFLLRIAWASWRSARRVGGYGECTRPPISVPEVVSAPPLSALNRSISPPEVAASPSFSLPSLTLILIIFSSQVMLIFPPDEDCTVFPPRCVSPGLQQCW